MRFALALGALSAGLLVLPAMASAVVTDTYVDGTTGSDTNDCLQATTGGAGVGPCLTIQAGIGKASTGGTIFVAPGTYNESLNMSNGFDPNSKNKSLSATGTPANTIIDGGANRAITVENGFPESSISGFTLRTSGSTIATVFLGDRANVQNNVFDSTADMTTGVFQDAAGGGSIISGNTFSDDGAGSRIGVEIDGGTGPTTTSNVGFNTFKGTTPSTGLSDPIIVFGGNPSIHENIISGTNNNGSGSAIQVVPSVGPVAPPITDNVLSAPEDTGIKGISIESSGANATSATLMRNRIFDHGSGVSVKKTGTVEPTVTLEGDLIYSGEANSVGLNINNTPNVTAINTTIVDNQQSDVFLDNAADFVMNAGILSKVIQGNGTFGCTITNSRGVTGSGVASCDNFTTTADPQFVSPGSPNFDYHLKKTSPMIDAAGAGNTNFDLAGNMRNIEGKCPINAATSRDIGAYEFNPLYPTDCTAPGTSISSHPKRTIRTNSPRRRVRFLFRSTDAHSKFKCRIDRRSYSFCSSPKAYRLRHGHHTFRVYAINATGLADKSPYVFRFRIISK